MALFQAGFPTSETGIAAYSALNKVMSMFPGPNMPTFGTPDATIDALGTPDATQGVTPSGMLTAQDATIDAAGNIFVGSPASSAVAPLGMFPNIIDSAGNMVVVPPASVATWAPDPAAEQQFMELDETPAESGSQVATVEDQFSEQEFMELDETPAESGSQVATVEDQFSEQEFMELNEEEPASSTAAATVAPTAAAAALALSSQIDDDEIDADVLFGPKREPVVVPPKKEKKSWFIWAVLAGALALYLWYMYKQRQ